MMPIDKYQVDLVRGKPEVGSANDISCAASARATTLKNLLRKCFRKPQKIIEPQAHAQG